MDRDKRDYVLITAAGIAIGVTLHIFIGMFWHYHYTLPSHSNLILEQKNADDFSWNYWKLTDGNCVLNEHKADGDHITMWRCSYE